MIDRLLFLKVLTEAQLSCFVRMLRKSFLSTGASRSVLFASYIISFSSSSLIVSPSSRAMRFRSSNSMVDLFWENKIKAFSSSSGWSRSDILVVMMSRKSLKSMETWPSLSFSRSLFYDCEPLLRSDISLLISSLAGSKPSALRATFKSFMSMMPEPLVSKRSKASLISAFCASVSSYLYCPLTLFPFLPPWPGPPEDPDYCCFEAAKFAATFAAAALF